MHEKIQYEDIVVSLNYYYSKKINELQQLGIADVILDPGFGFGKTIEDQYKMIDEVEHIGFAKYPLLIGISRKSFIYKPLEKLPSEINEETQKPVSYTHLDVYKRKNQELPKHILQVLLHQRELQFCTLLFVKPRKLFGILKADFPSPVSYTHLDVYKRQNLFSKTECLPFPHAKSIILE